MVLAGTALIPCALALSSTGALVAMLTLMFAATLPPLVYSYVLFQREQHP